MVKDALNFATCPLPELVAAVKAGEHTGWADEVVLRLASELEAATSPARLAEIRKAERMRLASFFEGEQARFDQFSPDGLGVDFIAFLLRIDHG